jgi:hypothetical protein
MDDDSRPPERCDASRDGSRVYYRNLFKGKGDGVIVQLSQVVDKPGVYMNTTDGIMYKPSTQPGWYVHISNESRQKTAGKGYKYHYFARVFMHTDDINTALAVLASDHSRKCSDATGAEHYRPEPLLAYRCVKHYAGRGVVDTVNINTLVGEEGYPPLPTPKVLKEELYGDLCKERPSYNTKLVDDDVYHHFVDNLRHAIQHRNPFCNALGHTNKIGAANTSELEDVVKIRFASKSTQAEMCRKYANKRTTLAVGVLPKLGALTSKCRVRRVFPSSIGLEIAQRRVFGDQYHLQLDGVTIVKGTKFPSFKHTYDVSECDRRVYHYVRRLCGEDEDLLNFFIPCIYTKVGPRFCEQFYSGMYCTGTVNLCFSAAIAQSIGKHAYIQGDGLMFAEPVRHEHLRAEEPYTINGFDYSGSIPRYCNAYKRLTSPRLGKYRASRWELRRQIYITVLHANPYKVPHSLMDEPYAHLSEIELTQLAAKLGCCRRLLRYSGRLSYTSSGWDVADTVLKPVAEYSTSAIPNALVDKVLTRLL